MNWLIAHLIGDYLLQNDWMALNKKKSSLHCGVHVVIYTAVIFAFTGWPIWALVVVAATHFVQDRTDIIGGYMDLIGQQQFKQPPMWPWSYIAVDNIWHLVVLYGLEKVVQ